MKRVAVVAAIAALSVGAATARGAGPAPLVGIVGDRIVDQQLVRVDPATLRSLAGGVPLAAHRYGWSFSPDRSRLVLGSNVPSCAAAGTTLRLVDVERMRSLGDVRIAAGGAVQATAWLGRSRIVAVVGPGRCGSAKQTRVIALDVAGGRVVARTWVRGTLISTARAPGRLVLLLGARGSVGSARIAVVDRDGAVRERTLEAVAAGQRNASPGRKAQVATPGLAVNPSGRAFVVSGWNGVTEVDLATLRSGFHPLDERRVAKGGTSGSERAAVWLGNGLLAVTGSESVNREIAGRRMISTKPSGLRIVDTRTWRYRALDPEISALQPAGGILVAHGSSYAYDGRRSTSAFSGLVAYSRSGRELYRVFQGMPIGRVAAIGSRGYAMVGGTRPGNRNTVSFDRATGRIGRTFDRPLWELLL